MVLLEALRSFWGSLLSESSVFASASFPEPAFDRLAVKLHFLSGMISIRSWELTEWNILLVAVHGIRIGRIGSDFPAHCILARFALVAYSLDSM